MKLLTHFRSTSEYKSDQLHKREVTYIFNEEGINQKRSKFLTGMIFARYMTTMICTYCIFPNLRQLFCNRDQKNLNKQIINNNITTQKAKWLYKHLTLGARRK